MLMPARDVTLLDRARKCGIGNAFLKEEIDARSALWRKWSEPYPDVLPQHVPKVVQSSVVRSIGTSSHSREAGPPNGDAIPQPSSDQAEGDGAWAPTPFHERVFKFVKPSLKPKLNPKLHRKCISTKEYNEAKRRRLSANISDNVTDLATCIASSKPICNEPVAASAFPFDHG